MNRNKRSELTHRSELTQKVKNTTVNNNHYQSEVDDEDEEVGMPVSTLSVPLYYSPDTAVSTMQVVEETPPPPPQAIEYEHPKEEQPQTQSELPKNNSKRVLEKSISGLKSLKSMAGSSMTLLQTSSGGGGNIGIISPSNRMKAMLVSNSKKDGNSSDNGLPPPPPPPPPATTTSPSSPSSADDILRDLSNVVNSDEGGGPRPHSGNSLENYVLPYILRMDMMDTTTNHQGGMEVIKVSKVCPILFVACCYI